MLLHLDSISYGTAQAPARFNSLASTFCNWSVEASGGPHNERVLRRVSTNSVGSENGRAIVAPSRTQGGIWTPQPSIGLGMWLKIENVSRLWVSNSLNSLVGTVVVYGPTSAGLRGLYSFYFNSDGTIVAGRSQNSNVWLSQGVTASAVTDATWDFFEFWLTFGNPGLIIIRKNGSVLLTDTPVTNPTFPPGTTSPNLWSSVGLLAFQSENSPFLDVRMTGLYILDGQGARNNQLLGVRRVGALQAVANGAFTGWTPNTGAAWEAVQAIPPDDGTFIDATAPTTRSAFVFTGVPAGVNPDGVLASLYARKTGDGAAAVTPTLLDIDHSSALGIGSEDFRYYSQPYDTNPVDNQPFESADLAAPSVGLVKTT